ncbi:MAG: cytochrome P450, partial [Pseudomonadota bacterium]
MSDHPTAPAKIDEVNLLDPKVQDCPYRTYAVLRDEAPVYREPRTGFYVVTRYEDVRKVLLDTETFSSDIYNQSRGNVNQDRVAKIRGLFEEKGWPPAPTLAGRDDPNHKQMRGLFDQAFRAGKVRELDPIVEELAYKLIDDFIEDGRCDWVRQFAVPLPLIIIGRQMGAREEDLWKIKESTDAFAKRIGMMYPEEDELGFVEKEIEAQHYFQPIFEKLRKEPDE